MRLEIERCEVAFSGAEFGRAGPYELLTGRLHGQVDPARPENRGIALIQQAPGAGRGLVDYWCDIAILKPVELTAGNGRLLYDVLNRGEQKVLTAFNDAPRETNLRTGIAPGNGFLMRRGYTMAWSAWQGELAGPNLLQAGLPVAVGDGGPLVGVSREEFVFDSVEPVLVGALTYPAHSLDPAEAKLSVRRSTRERPVPLGPECWRYLSADQIEISRPEGFDGGAIFDFCYPARDPIVMGLAFAAIRDVVSFLRYSSVDAAGRRNPLAKETGAAAFQTALAFGSSQSGRVLRDLIWQGFNADLAGRRVFDGVFADVAGSRKSFVNFPFAQPGRFSRQHEDHAFPGDDFPFTYGVRRDSATRRVDGILKSCSASGACPKIIHTDSSSEYWQARAALVTTDPAGVDLDLPPNVRVYHYASVQHGGAAARPLPIFAYPTNPLSDTPLHRALLVALDDWVTREEPPPPSQFPTIARGELAPAAEVARAFPSIPGVRPPAVANTLSPWDHSVVPPAEKPGPTYQPLVPKTDPDGNEIGGVRLPAVAVPVATYTGWNVRREGYAPGELASVRGACFPFPLTRAEREATGDPRPSLEERYASREDYAVRIDAAAKALAAQRLLLEEDIERLVADATAALPASFAAHP
ncbi:MAG: alpha/beta hydrolase domain-containing protein [Caulobacteraceae bacterium]|nr:alpha/beta hydrolase domain-containing protein [Caulobacteraceae bacterium]